MHKYKDIIILISLFIVGGIISVILGQDANWDLDNYHYYGIWSLFNNRFGYDIMPSGIMSYVNPVLDIPLYFFIKYLNNYPRLISFIQSLSWGGGIPCL